MVKLTKKELGTNTLLPHVHHSISLRFFCNREQVASNSFAKPGGKYSAAGQHQSIHYLLDQYSKVYAIVTAPTYPARVAFLAVEELRDAFQEKYGTRAATKGEESLTRVAKTMLDGIIEKYELLWYLCVVILTC